MSCTGSTAGNSNLNECTHVRLQRQQYGWQHSKTSSEAIQIVQNCVLSRLQLGGCLNADASSTAAGLQLSQLIRYLQPGPASWYHVVACTVCSHQQTYPPAHLLHAESHKHASLGDQCSPTTRECTGLSTSVEVPKSSSRCQPRDGLRSHRGTATAARHPDADPSWPPSRIVQARTPGKMLQHTPAGKACC